MGSITIRDAGRGTVRRRCPAGLSRNTLIDSTAASKPSSAGRSSASSRSPTSVKATLRVVRLSSRTPSFSSRPRIVSLSVEREIPRCVAALAKLERSAMATKAFISAKPSFRIDRILRLGHADNAGLSNKGQSATSASDGSRAGSILSSQSEEDAQSCHGVLSMAEVSKSAAPLAPVSRYHPTLVIMHWLLAVLIIAALALGALVMVKIPNSDPMKLEALRSHMTGGVLIVVLMLVRLLVRTRTKHPSTASTGNPILDRLAW